MVNVLSRLALVATIATSAVNAVPTNNALYEDLSFGGKAKRDAPFNMIDGLPSKRSLESRAPQSCLTSYPDHFELTVVDIDLKDKRQFDLHAPGAQILPRSLDKRSCGAPSSLTINLQDGVLTDSQGRIGCIVANFQFQFDGPPQHGTIFADGWAICNGSLALHGQTVFYKCPSGRGEGEVFYNLYDRKWTEHCNPHLLNILPCNGDWEHPPEQYPPEAPPPKTPITQIGDGQLQAPPPGTPITQIGDGQLQAPPPVTSVDTPVPRITVIPDGQPQAPSHPQGPGGSPPSPGHAPSSPGPQQSAPPNHHPSVAPSPPRVSAHPDGQPQAPHHRRDTPITQIWDGQIQGGKPYTITQIGDGQIQAPPHGDPVTQIGDGQIQGGKGGRPEYGGRPGRCGPPHPSHGGECWDSGPWGPSDNGGEQWGGWAQGGQGKPWGHGGNYGPPIYTITQIGDGQIQAPPAPPHGHPLTQIEDGQIQAGPKTITYDSGNCWYPYGWFCGSAPAPTPIWQPYPPPPGPHPHHGGPPIGQIPDGQIQAVHHFVKPPPDLEHLYMSKGGSSYTPKKASKISLATSAQVPFIMAVVLGMVAVLLL